LKQKQTWIIAALVVFGSAAFGQKQPNYKALVEQFKNHIVTVGNNTQETDFFFLTKKEYKKLGKEADNLSDSIIRIHTALLYAKKTNDTMLECYVVKKLANVRTDLRTLIAKKVFGIESANSFNLTQQSNTDIETVADIAMLGILFNLYLPSYSDKLQPIFVITKKKVEQKMTLFF
jgi:hypothetical protein